MAVGDVESAASAEVSENLGSRLRQARQRSGMTLREVARQLGVSASFVSQLENGKSQPSVVTLYSLTQLLGVSIDQMFELERQPGDVKVPAQRGDGQLAGEQATRRRRGPAGSRNNGRLVRRTDLGSPADAWPQQESRSHWALTSPGSRPKLVMDSGVIWEQLAPNTGHYLDFIEIIYPPGSSSTNDDRMLRHVGFEFGYLLEGELQVTCGFEAFTVKAGEALGMDSSVPHLLKNLGPVPARGIWCVHHEHP